MPNRKRDSAASAAEIKMSILRAAIRILFILTKGCEPLDPPTAEYHAIFRGEARLHAIDFWIRYPDYLANELLDRYEATQKTEFLNEAERIFLDDEPNLRHLPMIRYRFGAYEKTDSALSVLVCRKLVKRQEQRASGRVQETEYLISPTAHSLVAVISADYPALSWYSRRTELVLKIAAGRGGSGLKARQYEQISYASTPSGSSIPPIGKTVRARCEELVRSSHA